MACIINGLKSKAFFIHVITDAIPKARKNIVQNNINNNDSLTITNFKWRTIMFLINKLTAGDLYSTLMSNIKNKPWFQIYFQKTVPKKTYNMGRNIFANMLHKTHICYAFNIKF